MPVNHDPEQLHFSFGPIPKPKSGSGSGSGSESGDGLSRWHAERRAAKRALADKLGLPLDSEVEVWLHDGIRLRGRLTLCEEKLFVEETRNVRLQLRIGKQSFEYGEIDSCVKTD